MAYIGQAPFQEFTIHQQRIRLLVTDQLALLTYANDVVRGAENALEVFVNNVRQEPGTGKAFTLGVDGSNELSKNNIYCCSSKWCCNLCHQ